MPNGKMLTEIALKKPKDWDKGIDHVNGLIVGIVKKYRLANEVRNLRTELAKERAKASAADKRGHNNPPERIPGEEHQLAQVDIIWANPGEVEAELEKSAPNSQLLKKAGQAILKAAKYFQELADIAAKEAAKSVGKKTGSILLIYIVARIPAIQALAEQLLQFAKTFL